MKPTPKQFIKFRKGRGNREFAYVTSAYVQAVLNSTFGWCWSFEVKDHGTSPDKSSVWVLGKLTVTNPKTMQPMIVKEQFGSSDIKKLKTGGEVDYADDMKSAATDAMKKCASLIGVAFDVYSQADLETVQAVQSKAEQVSDYLKEKRQQEAEEEKKQDLKSSGIITEAK